MNLPLLTYTPPLHRDLQPTWKDGRYCDCGEMANDDYSIHIYRAYRDGDRRKPVQPLINVHTGQPEEYGEIEFELWLTSIWFLPNRESFRAAHRLARVIRRYQGEGWVLRRDLDLLVKIEVAPNHNITILDGEFLYLPERLGI